MSSIRDLLPRILETRVLTGFVPLQWDGYPAKGMCVIAELHEFEIAILQNDTAEAAIEIADVAMYLLTMLHDLAGDDWSMRSPKFTPEQAAERTKWTHPERNTWYVRRWIVRAFEHWRLDNKREAVICLELALLDTMRLAMVYDFALYGAIVKKDAKNRTRVNRHGGKRADT